MCPLQTAFTAFDRPNYSILLSLSVDLKELIQPNLDFRNLVQQNRDSLWN